MKSAAITFAVIVGFLSSSAADAQAPKRIRGNIAAVSGDVIQVKTGDAKTVAVQLTGKTRLVFGQPIQLSDIKPGDFLGVTSVKRKDGTLNAYDVRPLSEARQSGSPAVRRTRRSDDDKRSG